MAFIIRKCEICGNLTPLPPTCSSCGRQVCGPCYRGELCKQCAARSPEVQGVKEVDKDQPPALPPASRTFPASNSNPTLAQATSEAPAQFAPPSHEVSDGQAKKASITYRELSSHVSRIRDNEQTSPSYDSQQASAWPPGTRDVTGTCADRISHKLSAYRKVLASPSIKAARRNFPESELEVKRIIATLDRVETDLAQVPSIEVAILGPSRHGKSTLLNSLAGCSLLPMSDIKPCTAAVVTLCWEPEWKFRLRFVSLRDLEEAKQRALMDADEYLERCRKQDLQDEQPDDPRYLKSILQRFLTLYGITQDESPERLVAAVREAVLPERMGALLGQVATPTSPDLARMQASVEKYLSTKDVYWTIVKRCDIAGPFENWHPHLRLVDLPGTNDTDPHRTAITNSLREKARAVAICTSDSNLGPDIESWLQNSTVLGDFLEATENRRQRLLILRTKFDAFHPEINDELVDEADDTSEDRLFQEAIERHKHEQTEAYRAMLRDIASPRIPFGESDAARRKREEMLARLNGIPVFFVSALAHEVFAGRYTVGRKTKKSLSEHFADDPAQTGIPGLRDFLNHMADEFLTQNYYEDLERHLDKEMDLFVRFFRRHGKMLDARLTGTAESLSGTIDRVETTIIPWVNQEVSTHVQTFRHDAMAAAKEIDNRLDHASQMSRRRMQDKAEKWMHIAWNSLKAASRKDGVHTTCHGVHIDINQDICSVLVDDLILAWSSYRDYVIRERVDTITQFLAMGLVERLQQALATVSDASSQSLISELLDGLSALSQSQRDELVRQLDKKVRQLESIRQPAYNIVHDAMKSTYAAIAMESGTGCQRRMREILMKGMEMNIDRIRLKIQQHVASATRDLMDHCTRSMEDFGNQACLCIDSSLDELRAVTQASEMADTQRRRGVIQQALAVLPTCVD